MSHRPPAGAAICEYCRRPVKELLDGDWRQDPYGFGQVHEQQGEARAYHWVCLLGDWTCWFRGPEGMREWLAPQQLNFLEAES